MSSNFREAIQSIPFFGGNAQATGLLAPIMRASGHVLYIVGALADGYTLTSEEIERELGDAAAHLVGTPTIARGAPISTTAVERVVAFCEAVAYASAEYPDWPEDERGRNLKDLADRSAALGSFFDLELAGLHTSDPGRTL